MMYEYRWMDDEWVAGRNTVHLGEGRGARKAQSEGTTEKMERRAWGRDSKP